VLITKLFTELGLMATAFALMAPTLAVCGIGEDFVWRISSAIMLAVLVPWFVTYPILATTHFKFRGPLGLHRIISRRTVGAGRMFAC